MGGVPTLLCTRTRWSLQATASQTVTTSRTPVLIGDDDNAAHDDKRFNVRTSMTHRIALRTNASTCTNSTKRMALSSSILDTDALPHQLEETTLMFMQPQGPQVVTTTTTTTVLVGDNSDAGVREEFNREEFFGRQEPAIVDTSGGRLPEGPAEAYAVVAPPSTLAPLQARRTSFSSQVGCFALMSATFTMQGFSRILMIS